MFTAHRTPKGTKDAEHDEQTAVTTSCGPGRQAPTPEGDTRSHPKVGYRGPAAGIEDTFPRFSAFRRNQMHRSLRAGLPPQRLPLTGFLTLSAVSSRCTLWLCFKPHPPLGFMGLQSFSRRGQPWCLSAPIALMPSGAPQRVGQADCVCGRRPVSHPANRTTDRRCRWRPWFQSFAPTGRPTLRSTSQRRTEPLLSWPLSSSRHANSTVGFDPSPRVLVCMCPPKRHLPTVLQGVNPAEPERNSRRSHAGLHEVRHLVRAGRNGLRRVTPDRLRFWR